MLTEKKNRLNCVLSAIFLVVYTCLTFIMFYRQATGIYLSDMDAYVAEVAGTNTTYSFPYPLMFDLGKILNQLLNDPALATATACTFLNALSPVVLQYCIDSYLLQKSKRTGGILTTIATYSILFVSMLLFPFSLNSIGIEQYGSRYVHYVGPVTQNPWYNATYFATRAFSVVAFFLFIQLYDKYENNFRRREFWIDGILFIVFLSLSILAKPSFAFVLLPTAALMMFWKLFRVHWKNFQQTAYFAVLFLPAIAILLYQYSKVFVPTEEEGERGIGIGFAEVWNHYCKNIPVCILLVIAFPLVFAVINRKLLIENTLLKTSWIMLVVSLIQALFLYEKGFRKYHGNFDWGYAHAQQFVFIATVTLLVAQTVEWKTSTKPQKIAMGAEWLLFAWHTVSGLLIAYPYIFGTA